MCGEAGAAAGADAAGEGEGVLMVNAAPTVENADKAARVMLARRKLRENLVSWCRHCGYEPALHHRLLLTRLERLARGEIARLAIFMPPGSAKSTYASILSVPWFLAMEPKAMVLAASHTVELAEKWGRRVRNLIREHELELGITLADDTQAAGRWGLKSGGEYYAAGAGTGIAGFRADLAIIDDPIRSREDADSPQVRDRIWDWYKADLGPRMRPGGRIALIQTRWHEDDLAGRILAEMARGGDKWEVISLPAQAGENDLLCRAPGEWLWDDDPDYSYGVFLRHEKATQPARNWSALYQQQPTREEGDYFKDEWFKACDKFPPRQIMSVYGGSDYAVTAAGGDYTVHVVVGVDPAGKMYLLDLWRKQTTSDKWIEAWCDLVRKWEPSFWAEERGQIISGVGPFITQRMIERNAWTGREQFVSRGDKGVRAQSFRGRMGAIGLYCDVRAAYFADLRAELLAFPAGKHDDQVDALGLLGQLLDKFQHGRYPAKPPIENAWKRRYAPAEAELADYGSTVKLL